MQSEPSDANEEGDLPDPALEAIAAAILDGAPIDWQNTSQDSDSGILDQLHVLADLAALHRSLTPEPVGGSLLETELTPAPGKRWGPLTLQGGPSRELARVSGSERLLLQDWTPDGAAVIFTRWIAKPDEPVSLWRVSIHGGDPQALGLSMVGVRDVSVHPEGARITFTAGWPKNELWVMENFLTEKLR